eukprot:7678305-Pyramimonas_sp.AAC.2
MAAARQATRMPPRPATRRPPADSRQRGASEGFQMRTSSAPGISKGLWAVECTLAVIGIGGPVK